MVQGLAFLSKKSWHVQNFNNREKVWLAEQREEQEKAKAKELAKQIQQEREQEEFNRITGNKSVVKDRGIDWMYHGHDKESEIAKEDAAKKSEEYLLGKEFVPDASSSGPQGDLAAAAQEATGLNAVVPIDGKPAAQDSLLSTEPSTDRYAEPSVADRNQAWRNRHDDPMFLVTHEEMRQQREMEKKKELFERVTGKRAVNVHSKEGEQEDALSEDSSRRRRHKERKRHKKDSKKKRHKKEDKKKRHKKEHSRERRHHKHRYSSDEEDDEKDKETKEKDYYQEEDSCSDRSRGRGRYQKTRRSRSRSFDRNRDYERKERRNARSRSRSPARLDDRGSRREDSHRYHHHNRHEQPRRYDDRRDLDEFGRHNHHHHQHRHHQHNRDRYPDWHQDEDRRYQRSSHHRYHHEHEHSNTKGHGRKDPPRQEPNNFNNEPETKPKPKKEGYGLQGVSKPPPSAAADLGPDRDLLRRKREARQAERQQHYSRASKRPMTAQERAEALSAMEQDAQHRTQSRRPKERSPSPNHHNQQRSGQASFLNDMARDVHGVSGNGMSMKDRVSQNRGMNQRRNDGFL